MSYPKIELHVHLEGTLRPETLLAIAGVQRRLAPSYDTGRAGRPVPFHRPRALHRRVADGDVVPAHDRRLPPHHRRLCRRGRAARRSRPKASFAPLQPVRRGVAWETIYEGFCDGIAEARETHGLEMRLTRPDAERHARRDGREPALRHRLPRQRHRRCGSRRVRARVPAAPLRGRLPARPRGRPRLCPARGRAGLRSTRSATQFACSTPTVCATASAPMKDALTRAGAWR